MTTASIDRRRLLALGGYGMVMTSLTGLAACGGGGGDAAASGGVGGGGGGGGGTTGFEGNGAAAAGTAGTPVSAAQRVATLDAVASLMTASAGTGLRFDSTALAQHLKAMTAFQRVGISSRQQNVWALFTDGRALVLPNNLDPVAPTSGGAGGGVASATAPRQHTLAASDRKTRLAAPENLLPALLTQGPYRQLDMFGQVPVSAATDAAHLCQDFVGPDTLPQLRRMALGRGFVLPEAQRITPPDQGYDNGVAGLRSLSGDGVFFITACSAEVGAEAMHQTVICVDTPADAASEATHAADFAAGRLTYAVTMKGVAGAWLPHKCLAITPAFVAGSTTAWSFPVESVAILNLSGGSVLADWAAVLARCGLNNVLTWDRPVSWRRMLAFADDLMQLLLATNNLDGSRVRLAIEPRLRSYGVGETLAYLVRRHLTDDANGATQANYLQASAAPLIVNTLLPTIDYVNIDEGQAVIELVGQFGNPQGSVTEARYGRNPPGRFSEALLSRAADAPLDAVGTLRDPLWNGDLVQSAPEPTALMRGGYLQALNGGRCSNAVPITHWQIPMHVVTTITGGLTLDVTVTLHLRADVRGHRMAPDGPRGGANRSFFGLSSTVESAASYVASGQIEQTVSGVTTTVSWSGGGSVANALGDIKVAGGGLLDGPSRRLTNFTVSALGGPPHDERTVKKRGAETLSDQTGPKFVSVAAVFSASGPLELVFDGRWVLQGNDLELLADTVDVPGIGTRARTTRLSWTAVTPDFPPEDTVGGV